MSTRSQAPTPVLLRVALVGLAAGAAGSSLMGPRILAGYTAVGLAVGVGLAIYSVAGMGRILPVLAGGLAITYPLTAVEQGEGGILWAAALTLMALAGAFVLRGLGRGVVGSLALCTSVVLHLGLLGSYLVLIAVSGNRLLAALVLMVTAFEVAYGFVAARAPDPIQARAVKGKPTGSGSRRRPRPSIVNPKASLVGVAACAAAAQLARPFLPSALGILSSLTLGIAVGAAATLGHAAAAITSEDLESGPEGVVLDPGAFTSLNALLFAAGTFYYGFRLYLT